MKTQTREHHQMQAVNSATALLAPRTEREYPVLFRSPNVNKCQDAGWIIPFAALLAFAAFYGIRGAQLVTNPRAFCSIVSGSQLDSGGLLSPPSHVAGADLYGNCIHFVVVGDLATARSSCLVFAVNSLVASNASISIPSVKSWSPSLLSSDLVSSLHSSASHSLSHTVTHSLASHAHSHKRDGIPSMPSVSIPPQIQSAFTMCTLFVSLKSPNAPSMCVQYGVLAFFGAAGANSTQFQSLIQSCVAPILDGTISPFTTTSTKVNSCVDSGISMLPGNNSSSLSPNTAIFTHCMESISNKADVQQMEACVRNALPTVANATLSAFLAGCVDPVVKGGTQGLVGCISAGFQAVFPQLSSADASLAVSTCLTPMLNGTTDALGVGARCLEFGLTKALNGAGPVFALIEQAVVGLLGGDLAKTFGSACLQQTIGDLSAGKGFPLQGCLFQGLAKEFCEDVMNAGPFSIANSINTYFNSFRDRMAQNAGKVAITFLFVVGAAVGMACLWMSILVLFGEGLIRSSLVGDIVGLIFLVTVNFIILNIPVAILLLIYLIVKIGWFIYIYKRIRFAATLLRVCVAHLKHHPGAFFLGTFLFIWNAGWCFLFACAYLEIYTPNVFSSPQLMTVSLVFLVLAFFWSFEVWKGLLGVSVAGSLGTWYYFGYEQKINVGIKGVSQSPLQLRHPILASFAHASTLSFGSVCVGSLFLAVLKVGHWFFKRAKNSKSTFVKTFVNALFGWMESILKVYDLYSFVRVGVEYEGYFEAAKKTWGLLEEQGVDALVNDDSIVSITGTTSVLGSLVVGTLAFFMSKIFYRLDWDISLLCVVVSLFFGWAELSIMGVTVEMGVVALFVVMAEDPEVLMIRHPVECKELVAALIERCAERGWQVPTEFEILNEKMALQSVSQPS